MDFELKQIKELMAAMGRLGLTRLKLKIGESELELETAAKVVPSAFSLPERAFAPPHEGILQASPHPFREGVGSSPLPHKAIEGAPAEKEGRYVTSPMVGTFYNAPAPDAPPFVSVGDAVEEGSVVCIIEAMKVMNEVKAGVKGVVKEVLVESGHPVEFGTKLFRVV